MWVQYDQLLKRAFFHWLLPTYLLTPKVTPRRGGHAQTSRAGGWCRGPSSRQGSSKAATYQEDEERPPGTEREPMDVQQKGELVVAIGALVHTSGGDGGQDGVGRRWGVIQDAGTHIYLWPIHVDVWQKSSQYCHYLPI